MPGPIELLAVGAILALFVAIGVVFVKVIRK
jgi:hypothetical protein